MKMNDAGVILLTFKVLTKPSFQTLKKKLDVTDMLNNYFNHGKRPLLQC